MNLKMYQNRLQGQTRPVVVDFWAPWCAPCRTIKPILKNLAQEYQGKVDVWEINADEHPDLLPVLKIYGIPTLIAYQSGQEVARYIGARPASDLRDLFRHLAEGKIPPRLSLRTRLVRIALAVGMAIIGWFNPTSWPFYVVAGFIFFSAVYDRCPVWNAVTSWLKQQRAKHTNRSTR
ncbi:MAG: thioredoxin domain-containing protein [Anaerolineales bacterium]|nr:thioredoxin domain-containing protein [Anaerolineales bacterium]MCX7607592.1 thioredoxin domain-containing protein [Anaerolineales bacterium]MDW8227299.1 thioredoxin domain-containing protein [Anaerolineales bacterium]